MYICLFKKEKLKLDNILHNVQISFFLKIQKMKEKENKTSSKFLGHHTS